MAVANRGGLSLPFFAYFARFVVFFSFPLQFEIHSVARVTADPVGSAVRTTTVVGFAVFLPTSHRHLNTAAGRSPAGPARQAGTGAGCR